VSLDGRRSISSAAAAAAAAVAATAAEAAESRVYGSAARRPIGEHRRRAQILYAVCPTHRTRAGASDRFEVLEAN
jgi:hypothetical protein